MIIKEKRPQSITFNRNDDDTYEVTYTGIAMVDENNNIERTDLKIPRCILEWEDTSFICQPKIKEILNDNNNNELLNFTIDE